MGGTIAYCCCGIVGSARECCVNGEGFAFAQLGTEAEELVKGADPGRGEPAPARVAGAGDDERADAGDTARPELGAWEVGVSTGPEPGVGACAGVAAGVVGAAVGEASAGGGA